MDTCSWFYFPVSHISATPGNLFINLLKTLSSQNLVSMMTPATDVKLKSCFYSCWFSIISLSAKALFSQAPPPKNLSSASSTSANQPSSPAGATAAVPANPSSSSSSQEGREKQRRRRRGERKGATSDRLTSDSIALGAESQIDASRLDLRVGRILSVRRHSLAEAMSVQEVDLGENAPRTVVSKLGEKTHLDEVTLWNWSDFNSKY